MSLGLASPLPFQVVLCVAHESFWQHLQKKKKTLKIATCSFYIAVAKEKGTKDTGKVNKRTPTQQPEEVEVKVSF